MTLPDDPLLQSLGELSRVQNDEAARLERRIREGDAQPSASRDREALATAPLGVADRARIHEHVFRVTRPTGQSGSRWTSQRAASNTPLPRNQRPALKVVRSSDAAPETPLREDTFAAIPLKNTVARTSIVPTVAVRSLRRAFVIALPLCVAAGAVLWLQPKAPIHQLPDYSLELLNAPAELRGAAEPRSEPAKPVELAASSRLVLSLRPSTAVQEPVRTRALLRQGDEVRVWPATIETSPQGAVRVQLDRANTNLRGPADLVVLVGHAENPPPEAAAGPGWQRFSIPVILGP